MRSFARNESGATAIEYALIATIITVGIIASLTAIGTTLATTFSEVKSGFTP